jgi:co-chaperonin GroES (HSP10)
MEIRPMSDRVLIAQNAKQETTESGIILEGTRGTGEITKATVLAIGPDVTEVKVGDVVLPEWAKASPVKIDGKERAMIKEEFIIAVCE